MFLQVGELRLILWANPCLVATLGCRFREHGLPAEASNRTKIPIAFSVRTIDIHEPLKLHRFGVGHPKDRGGEAKWEPPLCY